MANLFLRHIIVGSAGAALTYIFWLSRPDWDGEMRFWKAVGDASLILLYLTLILGPSARFVRRVGKLLPYRREIGIWFGLFAFLHTFLILDGWARWDVQRFMGYEFVPPVGRMVRLESGFGLANIVGLVAVALAVPLMVTSTDWAVRRLGGSVWKFLHYSAYIVFYLVVLHTAYFMYIHFTESFHRVPPDPNWFQIPFAVITGIVLALQAAAFIKTAGRQRKKDMNLGADENTRPTRQAKASYQASRGPAG